MRAYLLGERAPGERTRVESDPFGVFEPYVRQRLADDPHVWATVLFDEVGGLGYEQSYPTFVRKVRNRGLRPSCGACAGTRGQATVVIDHPPGEECQSVLAGVVGHSVAVSGVCARWCPVPFRSVPGLDHRKPGPAAPRGGHRRGAATPGGHGSAVAG